MKILAMDTSGPNCSVCILDEEKVICDFNLNTGTTHSQTLLPIVDTLKQFSNVELSDIDVFACGIGPGSFTGLRIGLATVKGFALSINKPVIGVSTLLGLAYNTSIFDGLVCSVLDAKNNNVYAGIFKYEKDKPILVGDYITDDVDTLINILKEKKKVVFTELFEEHNTSFIVVTFLSILEMTKEKEILIKQDTNFSNITIGDFYDTLSADYYDSTAILGGLNATARKNQEKSSSQSGSGGGGSAGGGSSGGAGGESSPQTINPPDTDKITEVPEIITNPEQLTAGTSSIIGDRGTENFGIAVFKDDKLCGKLTAVESICHLLINNDVDSCIISIKNPLSKNEETETSDKMELQLFPNKNSKITLDIIDNKPNISINISLNADIMTLIKNNDYETNEALTKISNSAQKYLEEQFNNYLNKVCKELNTDIDQFSTKAPAHFATISDFEDFNWPEKYKNAEFKVEIDVNVISSMLLTKT